MKLLPFLLLFSLNWISCSLGTDIKGTDSTPIMLAMRLKAPLGLEEKGAAKEPLRIELVAETALGDFRQKNSGVSTDYQLVQLGAGLRYSLSRGRDYSLDFLGGLIWTRAEIEFTSGGSKLRSDRIGLGPQIGLELDYRFTPEFEAYGRATYGVLLGDLGASGQAEAGLRYKALDQLHFFLAYRHWRYRNEDILGNKGVGDLDLSSNGFLLGAEIRF
jgi:hypothetical protein